MIDGLDGFGDDPVGIHGIGTQERRLGTEVMPTGSAVMDAHDDGEQDRLVQIEIKGGARCVPDPLGRLVAAVEGQGGQAPADLAHDARYDVDRGKLTVHGRLLG